MNGIVGCLKKLPPNSETSAVMYAIMSNLAVIQTNLASGPTASQFKLRTICGESQASVCG
jgi:hypothetical protein